MRCRPYSIDDKLGVQMVQNGDEEGEVNLLNSDYTTNRFAFTYAWWSAYGFDRHIQSNHVSRIEQSGRQDWGEQGGAEKCGKGEMKRRAERSRDQRKRTIFGRCCCCFDIILRRMHVAVRHFLEKWRLLVALFHLARPQRRKWELLYLFPRWAPHQTQHIFRRAHSMP